MKSLTNGNPRSADAAPTVGALLSSDAGAISSAAEGAVESGVGGDRDRVNGDAMLQTTASETGSPLGLQRKSLRVTFPEFEVVSGYMDPPRPWNDGRCLPTITTHGFSRIIVAFYDYAMYRLNSCSSFIGFLFSSNSINI